MARLPDRREPLAKEIAVGELRLVRGWTHKDRPEWRPVVGGLGLRSHFTEYIWTPGTNKAFHSPNSAPAFAPRACRAPEPGCGCGLYGVFEYEAIPGADIVGLVEYWGRVRMGALGVRAEYARIVALAPGILHNYRYSRWPRGDRHHFKEVADYYEADAHYTQSSLIRATAASMSVPEEFGIHRHGDYG